MRVKLIDPSAFTPPYDRALAAALAAAGVDVELITSEFLYGLVPPSEGYGVSLDFYRRTSRKAAGRAGRANVRRARKVLEHIPDMVRLRHRLDREPDGPDPLVTHYQWLTLPYLDRHLLSGRRPRVMTAHYILPLTPSNRDRTRTRRVFDSMDAVIAHSRGGAERLVEEVGLPADRVRVIPHGTFDYLTRQPEEMMLPPELGGQRGDRPRGPVILFFGLMRPYKGIDTLLDACAALDPTAELPPELWIVGNPRMDLTELRERAGNLGIDVRWVTRFIEDAEIPEIMRHADLLVLPYHDGEQSGVLYTGIAFGKAMIVSEVGGIGEVAREHGLARVVAPGDADDLAAALTDLTADGAAREELAARSAAAAAGPFSWSVIAGQTLDLYRELTG
ncbi:MAG: glycosyltransferase family 4 protein [Actinomycetota bacterium]|nr:glycosyltransferase family 4 protein [Actinomycetota bacterium]